MTQATAEQRDSFRMPAGNKKGAGVLVGRKIIPAEMADFSSRGARLVLRKKVKKIAVGDRVRVGITSGLYEAIVRRIFKDESGRQVIGVEFVSLVAEELQIRNSTLLSLGCKQHNVSGRFGPGTICFFAVLLASFYFVWRYFF